MGRRQCCRVMQHAGNASIEGQWVKGALSEGRVTDRVQQ